MSDKTKHAIEIIIEAASYSKRMNNALTKEQGRDDSGIAVNVAAAATRFLNRPLSMSDRSTEEQSLAANQVVRTPKPAKAHRTVENLQKPKLPLRPPSDQ